MSDVPAVEMVYQVRVVLAEISPLIWRRLEIPGSATLAGLHQVLQAAFGWDSDDYGYLHEFTVHGVGYGTTAGAHSRGADVCLTELGLRERERFGYVYNFFAGWRHDLRVEKISPAQPRRRYPRCLAGARRVPPPDCDGPAAYLRLRDHQPAAVLRLAEILGDLLDRPGERLCDIAGLREELAGLAVYAGLDEFDRKAINIALSRLTGSRCGTTDP